MTVDDEDAAASSGSGRGVMAAVAVTDAAATTVAAATEAAAATKAAVKQRECVCVS